MEMKRLGNVNVRVPEIGLGVWKYKGGVEPLRKGVELGACLIDTAEMYRTEDVVGQAVKDIRDLTADGIDGLLGGNLDGDLDGDGIRDVVDIGDDGEVIVRRISKDLRISTNPFWSHRPGMMIRELWVKDLDGDGRSDVLLRHARSLKVLVTR